MTDFNQFHDSITDVQQPKKLPDMLNVLTILTFIGCAIGILSSIYSYFTVCKSAEVMANMDEQSSGFMAGFMSGVKESAIKQCEMKLPVLLISIISILLCFVGALQMRKLKKSGFMLYTIGNLLGPIALLILISSGFGFTTILGFLFPVIFIILYASQLKHMH